MTNFTKKTSHALIHSHVRHHLHIASISKWLKALVLTLCIQVQPIAFLLDSQAAKAAPTDKFTQSNLYKNIIDEALTGTICDTNRKIIVDACLHKNSVLNKDTTALAKGDAATSLTAKTLSHKDREMRKVLNFAATSEKNGEDRARALHYLGLLMRPMQDFYFYSNYIELKIEKADSTYNFTPFSIELLKLSQVGRDARAIAMFGFEYGDIDKSSPDAGQGRKLFQKATYYSIAKELSLKETQRQWNTVEQLIKVKFPEKASQIISALKQSPCPSDIKFEDD